MSSLQRLLSARRERPSGGCSSNYFDEFAASHYSPKGSEHADHSLITAGICDRRNGV
jgi:hypothetical protein